MAKRRALIVDDSKTAQIRLRKMLERFDMEVDEVFSAEEALGYLSYRMPAVIFLDHHMEGMDGLEALKIIKTNPGTALIPVIMYTSEQGDVYVGQARALGAIDILSKEIIKHESIEKVLASLGILTKQDGKAKSQGESSEQSVEAKSSAQLDSNIASESSDEPLSNSRRSLRPPAPSYDLSDDGASYSPYQPAQTESNELDAVQRQVSKLFELHIAKVRQEIEQSTKFIVRRLAKDQQAKAVARKPGDDKAEPPVEPAEDYSQGSSAEERGGMVGWFMGIILIGIGVLGYHLYINNQHQEILQEQFDALIERSQGQEALVARLLSKIETQGTKEQSAQNFADRQILLDAMSWAVNVNTQVAFGEQALSDQRIYMLGELLALLNAANFSGAVFLDVHLGNFCVVEAPSGELFLPEPESNIEDCVFIADKNRDTSLNAQVSVGFLNYLQSAPVITEGNIDVEMNSLAYSSPKYSYPPITSATSAGDWNRIAAKNNRISINFSAN